MKKIGLIYSFNTRKTVNIAENIKDEFGDKLIVPVDAETIEEDIFLSFDNLILGVPTWFDGELPRYWDELVPALEDLSMEGKKIAIFGLGDQVGYPENFVDGIGIMAELVSSRGAEIVGKTSIEGYKFEKSRAVRNNEFLGLAIDFENQHSLNDKRVKEWVDQLKKEFNLS